MKILLLGANGRTGREVLHRALDAGYRVTALVRSHDRLADISHPRLAVQVGNVVDPGVLESILPGHDLVISTLGPRTTTNAACRIYSESAIAIVQAMQQCGVNRLLVTSSALLFPDGNPLDRILRWVARNNVRHAGLMEDAIRASNLQWTIARLGFLNNRNSSDYKQAEDAPCGRSISRAAVARFLLAEARQSSNLRKVIGLCS